MLVLVRDRRSVQDRRLKGEEPAREPSSEFCSWKPPVCVCVQEEKGDGLGVMSGEVVR